MEEQWKDVQNKTVDYICSNPVVFLLYIALLTRYHTFRKYMFVVFNDKFNLNWIFCFFSDFPRKTIFDTIFEERRPKISTNSIFRIICVPKQKYSYLKEKNHESPKTSPLTLSAILKSQNENRHISFKTKYCSKMHSVLHYMDV